MPTVGTSLNVLRGFPTFARGENANALAGDETVATIANKAIFFMTAMVMLCLLQTQMLGVKIEVSGIRSGTRRQRKGASSIDVQFVQPARALTVGLCLTS